MGQAHEVVGSHNDAEQIQNEALAALPSNQKEQSDAYRKVKALILQRLGAVQLSHRRFEQAENAFNEALKLVKDVSDTSAIQIDALKGCVHILKESGRDSELPAVQNRLALLGKSQTSTSNQEAWSKLMMQGRELETAGESKASDNARWEALALAEKFGPCDPRYVETIRVLASSFVLREEWKQAEPLLHRSYKLEKECHGPESEAVLLPLSRLAAAYTALGDLEKADKYAQKALTIHQKQTKVSHTTTAQIYHRLAQLRAKQDNLPEALDWEKKALTEFKKTIRGPRVLHLQLEQGMARIYREMNNFAEAEKSLRNALDIIEANGVMSNTVWGRLSLADCLEAEGKTKEAIALYKETIDLGEISLQGATTFSRRGEIENLRKALLRTLKLYCKVVEKENDPKQVAKLRKRIAELSNKKEKQDH